jgi:hypothetical protein
MSVYDLCEAYAPKRVGLTLRLLDDDVDDPGSPSVLIEGSSGALRLLAHLILAVAERDGGRRV